MIQIMVPAFFFFCGLFYGAVLMINPAMAMAILSFLGYTFGTAIALIVIVMGVIYIHDKFS